jgi:hypothetical protein
MRARSIGAALAATLMLAPTTARAAAADTPRDLLVRASFLDRDKGEALAHILAARNGAAARLQAAPGDPDAAVVRATATGYHAKLTGSRGEAIAARRLMEALIARDPRNAEAQLALGGWHLGAVNKLGGLIARAALGAQKSIGLGALDRAVALGGNRAMFAGLSALLRLQLDPADPRAMALAEAAAKAPTPTLADRAMQRAAAAILAPLRGGNAKAIRQAATRLLPLGQLPGEG